MYWNSVTLSEITVSAMINRNMRCIETGAWKQQGGTGGD